MIKNKVISFSLWGNKPIYCVGAIRNAEIALSLYPEWICHYYIGLSTPTSIIDKLNLFPNVKTILMPDYGDWKGMFWRFATCDNPEIEVSIFRDTDSRLSIREKNAVEEWLNSDKTFHIMRDHPFHGYPILGGMWGYKNNNKFNIKSLIANFSQSDRYGTDYEFFGQVLYPLIGLDKIVHDEFFEKIPFPTTRHGTEFVGDVFDENDTRHPEYYKYILQ